MVLVPVSILIVELAIALSPSMAMVVISLSHSLAAVELKPLIVVDAAITSRLVFVIGMFVNVHCACPVRVNLAGR